MTFSDTFSPWADTIRLQKYSKIKSDGSKETWPETAHRVVTNVMAAVDAAPALVETLIELVTNRVFIPGGRYLASTGNEYHQTQNCLLLRAQDSREGWAEHLSNCSLALMTGARRHRNRVIPLSDPRERL